jgi:hypothetical protein
MEHEHRWVIGALLYAQHARSDVRGCRAKEQNKACQGCYHCYDHHLGIGDTGGGNQEHGLNIPLPGCEGEDASDAHIRAAKGDNHQADHITGLQGNHHRHQLG